MWSGNVGPIASFQQGKGSSLNALGGRGEGEIGELRAGRPSIRLGSNPAVDAQSRRGL